VCARARARCVEQSSNLIYHVWTIFYWEEKGGRAAAAAAKAAAKAKELLEEEAAKAAATNLWKQWAKHSDEQQSTSN
jgi:hypothetical protein